MRHQLHTIRTENLGVVESTRLGEISRKYKKSTDSPGKGWKGPKDPDVLSMCKDFMDMLSVKKGTETPTPVQDSTETSAELATVQDHEPQHGSEDRGTVTSIEAVLESDPNSVVTRETIAKRTVDDWGETFVVQGIAEDDNNLSEQTGMVPILGIKKPGLEPYKIEGIEGAEGVSEDKFNQYKHHQFVRRWGLINDPSPELIDEEWYIPDPPILDKNDPQYLCEMCRQIDFKVLLEQPGLPGNQLPGPTSIELLGFWKIKEEVNCRFCNLVRRCIESDELLAGELHSDRTRFKLNVMDGGPGCALRLEVELDSTARSIVLQRIDSSTEIPLRGLSVDSKTAALDRLREWLHVCENTHLKLPDHVRRSLKLGITVLRVIDTEENRICEVETSCPYVCLSYVWGPPIANPILLTTKTKTQMETIDGLVDFDIPPTIKDAMRVTRDIGLRYVWVDALCIVQDDDDDKKIFIPNMDIIYGNATLTIVACTNLSPAEALPGVSVPRQCAQIIEQVQGLTIGAALHDTRIADPVFETSKWNSRAWTFQERGLSQRSVYFGQSQMSFTCPHGSAVEDTAGILEKINKSSPTSVINPKIMYDLCLKIWDDRTQEAYRHKSFVFGTGKSAVTLYWKAEESDADNELEPSTAVYFCRSAEDTGSMGTLQQVMNQETLWNIYKKAVKGYTKRNMSVQSDVVNAFAGITHLIAQGTNTKFWYGMPEFAFDQALLWVPREKLIRRCDADGVALFPSWAWAAWEGHTSYSGNKWHNSDNRPPLPVIEWLLGKDPEQILQEYREMGMPDELYEEEKKALENRRTLLIKADAAKMYHVRMRDSEWEFTHEENTRHIYTHAAYEGVKFDYPIHLPDEVIEDRPGKNGELIFRARAVHAKLCDMTNTPHVQEIFEDRHLQIGAGEDMARQRIIYHQGYRAGVLSLNVTDQDIANATDRDGDHIPVFIVAMARDSLQQVPHFMSESFLLWQKLDPRMLQAKIFQDELEPGPGPFTSIPLDKSVKRQYAGHASLEEWMMSMAPMRVFVPDGTVAPDKGVSPVFEDGDPYWDEGRFGEPGYCDVYNVLVIRPLDREGNTVYERIGAGRMNCAAFHHARPSMAIIALN
jgi:hypothetical protein